MNNFCLSLSKLFEAYHEYLQVVYTYKENYVRWSNVTPIHEFTMNIKMTTNLNIYRTSLTVKKYFKSLCILLN